MTLVDMMHDGVRAVVYRYIVAGPEEKGEIEAEYKEFSMNISRYLKEIETLKKTVKKPVQVTKTNNVIELKKPAPKTKYEPQLKKFQV